jgi:hypothetical protein
MSDTFKFDKAHLTAQISSLVEQAREVTAILREKQHGLGSVALMGKFAAVNRIMQTLSPDDVRDDAELKASENKIRLLREEISGILKELESLP